LDRAYEDRLDGTIDDRFWREMNDKWRTDQDQVAGQLDRLRGAQRNYVDEAAEILELAQTAYSQYIAQEQVEKRKLLRLLLSNCTFDGVTLYPTYKTPFDLIAEGVKNNKKLRSVCSHRTKLRLDPNYPKLFRFRSTVLSGQMSAVNPRPIRCNWPWS